MTLITKKFIDGCRARLALKLHTMNEYDTKKVSPVLGIQIGYATNLLVALECLTDKELGGMQGAGVEDLFDVAFLDKCAEDSQASVSPLRRYLLSLPMFISGKTELSMLKKHHSAQYQELERQHICSVMMLLS